MLGKGKKKKCSRPSWCLYRLDLGGVRSFPRAGDQEALTVPVRVRPDVQRGPHPAELFLEERDGRQGNRAVAPQEPLLLGARGQVGGFWTA